ncbi:MAG TPA: 4-hydroxy-3-methylbut-2-enyl diphosphate reductase [Gemmatimonadales bacterium]|nr:4-hydroxy-3-methylbut-2-enyl diphosphate reductase [Gemmatimonadales bacterium]
MDVTLAQPRGFCAGVVRAIEIVERALATYGPPVYVLHEIVHNHRVLEELSARGAVFVEELDEVPRGSLVIFSAHGVAAATFAKAEDQGLRVIDATCPLVTKVHREVAAHARVGREVVLIGHAGHAEVSGTFGRYDRAAGGDIYLVQTVDDVARLTVRNPEELAYVTQTTLSVDDTRQVIAALRQRFPAIEAPRKDDICYATQNRQNAVKQLAGEVDVLVVVGARNSSNSNRLREVAEQMGVAAYLVQDADDLDAAWFRPDTRVGVTAGASAPEVLVAEVLRRLQTLGASAVREIAAEPETVTFSLPPVLTTERAARSVP